MSPAEDLIACRELLWPMRRGSDRQSDETATQMLVWRLPLAIGAAPGPPMITLADLGLVDLSLPTEGNTAEAA